MKPTADTLRAFLQTIAETPKHEARNIPAAKRESVYRMIRAVYANQTADEQAVKVTNHSNGKGFTGCDAFILSDMAQSSAAYGNLTGPQARIVAKKLVKYAKQILASYETHSKAALQEQTPAPVAKEQPQTAQVEAPRSYSNAKSAKQYNLLGERIVKTRNRAKVRPVTLVDGVNTASELAFMQAHEELRQENAKAIAHKTAQAA